MAVKGTNHRNRQHGAEAALRNVGIVARRLASGLACPVKEKGHNGDVVCATSGFPVSRGKLCFRHKDGE